MKRIAFSIVFVIVGASLVNAAGNTIKGCWIGLDASGSAPQPSLFTIESATGGILFNEAVINPDGTLYGRKLVGQSKPSNIVLRTFPGTGDPLEAYAADFLAGKIGSTSGGWVTMKKGLNAVNVKLARTAFFGALPNFVKYPALDVNSNDPAPITVSLSPGSVVNDTVTPVDLGSGHLPPLRTFTRQNFALYIDRFSVSGIKHVNPLQVDFGQDAAGNVLLNARNLVIKTDVLSAGPLYSWRKTVLDGKVDRKSISIVYLSDSGAEIARLNLFDCWPAGIDDPVLAQLTGEVTTILTVGSASYTHP